MVDDVPEPANPLPDGRPRREGPTIDLQATEIASDAKSDATSGTAGDGHSEPRSEPGAGDAPSRATPAPVSRWATALVSGLVAALLVIGLGWVLGWFLMSAPSAPPQIDAAAIDSLSARIAAIESKITHPSPSAPDPAAAARIDAAEKSLAALRSDLTGLRAQTEQLAANFAAVKAAPGETAPPPDLAAINERIAGLERTLSANSAALAQQAAKSADAKPADDVALRRVVTAGLLDISVRQGDPYVAALAAAKSLAANPDALKPLDGFAKSGVPGANALSRELLMLIPKLSPPQDAATGSGMVERLEAGASRLVRIERTDAVGNDRGAIVARATAAALRNDAAEARRELKTLAAADRAAAQAWIDKSDARDAALAASRQFATDAMAELTRPGQ